MEKDDDNVLKKAIHKMKCTIQKINQKLFGDQETKTPIY